MLKSRGKKYLVAARSDASGWVEARAISDNNSKLVSQFIYEDVICRHGMFAKAVYDRGPENKKLTADLMQRYDLPRVVISMYYS